MITKVDRLGRSPEHLIDLSIDLQNRGLNLVVLDQDIDAFTAVGRCSSRSSSPSLNSSTP